VFSGMAARGNANDQWLPDTRFLRVGFLSRGRRPAAVFSGMA